jgi:hypothetical protein
VAFRASGKYRFRHLARNATEGYSRKLITLFSRGSEEPIATDPTPERFSGDSWTADIRS